MIYVNIENCSCLEMFMARVKAPKIITCPACKGKKKPCLICDNTRKVSPAMAHAYLKAMANLKQPDPIKGKKK